MLWWGVSVSGLKLVEGTVLWWWVSVPVVMGLRTVRREMPVRKNKKRLRAAIERERRWVEAVPGVMSRAKKVHDAMNAKNAYKIK